MGLKDWIAPFITLLIGASTIFISYKNYQAQAAAKPSELARLELWSKLLTEAGLDLNALPDPEKLTSDQRVVLENYRVFLKRASLESKLRKVGIDSNRIFSLLMKRAHSSVKPTPIPIGDSISYYRLILPCPAVHLGSAGRDFHRRAHHRGHHRLPDWPVPEPPRQSA